MIFQMYTKMIITRILYMHYVDLFVCLNPGMDQGYISLFCLDSFQDCFQEVYNRKI